MTSNFNEFIIELSNIFKSAPLIGEKAQYLMAPEIRKSTIKSYNVDIARKSSVMLLFFPINNIPYFALIKRQKYNGHHSGQISFPGGKVDESDIDLYNTAQRETLEEIGVSSNFYSRIGNLSPLYIPPSNFLVYPFVCFCQKEPNFIIEEYEVEKLLKVDFYSLLKNPNKIDIPIDLNNESFIAPAYLIQNEKVWGATAMIISELIQYIKQNMFY